MLILIHIPKTGGTSIDRALRRNGAVVHSSHEIARNLKPTYDPDAWDLAKKVTMVRNPWDRAVSLYYWWGIERLYKATFQEWIRRGCPHHMKTFDPIDQMVYFTDEQGNDLVNYIGCFEYLTEEAVEIGKMISSGASPLQHLQPSSRPKIPYQKLYDGETAELLANHTRPFIERFGYAFD